MNTPNIPNLEQETKAIAESMKIKRETDKEEKIINIAIQIASAYVARYGDTTDPEKFVEEVFKTQRLMYSEVRRQSVHIK